MSDSYAAGWGPAASAKCLDRFTIVTLVLTATVAFLVGAIFAGGVARSSVSAGAPVKAASG